MDTVVQIEPEHLATVEGLVSQRLGWPVRHLRAEPTHSARQDRRYFQHALAVNGGEEISVFSKAGEAFQVNDALEHFLSDHYSPDFAAPKFYGSAKRDGLRIAVWSCVSGRRVRSLAEFSLAELHRIVRAVAAMNALTSDVHRRAPGIRVRGLVVIGAGQVREALHQLGGNDDVLAAAEGYRAVEGRMRQRLRAIERRYLSHQDVVARNIVFAGADSPPLFIDWENASLALPGSCLRHFCALDLALQRELAAHYVAVMQEKGEALTLEDVFFVMGAAQIQGQFRRGLKGRKLKPLSWALGAVNTYLA